MGIIKFKTSGGFGKTERFLKHYQSLPKSLFDRYGQAGVAALRESTPKDTGLTGESWSYDVEKTGSGYRISFSNSNVQNGIPVALLIQLGHGTTGGTFVKGIDYINPALRPIFDKLAKDLWKEVNGE